MDASTDTTNIIGNKRKNTNNSAKGKGNVRERTSASWDEYAHLKFIELCEQELSKGNRPGTYFNTNGWNNLCDKFNEITGRGYDKKQLKNHWDGMKAEWTLFKQLLRGESGLGWDERNKTITADNTWWEEKIKVDERFKKFRNKDLSLIWFRYDNLFSDIAATGAMSRAPCQPFVSTQGSGTRLDLNNEDNEVDVDTQADSEGFDDSDAAQLGDDHHMFPPSVLVGRSYGGRKSSSKKSKSGATSLKEDIHNLIQVISNKSTATSSHTATSGPTIKQCLDKLRNLKGLSPRSEIWNFAVNFIRNKENREIFMELEDDDTRQSWLEYNYDIVGPKKP